MFTEFSAIGITLNHDWAEPFSELLEDIQAAERRREFQIAWFSDLLYVGEYPKSMIELIGDRLPRFTRLVCNS